MEITPELIAKLERLSALRVGAEERELFAAQLHRVLEYMEILDKLDTESAAPEEEIVASPAPLRPDRVRASLPTEAVLANAPDTSDGFFRVPRFLGEGNDE